eukprot:10205577-Alexandrium_andersonii.AAC.1
MSASLVGSEMCIRDSAFTARRAHERALDPRGPGVGAAAHGNQFLGNGPVSYTHLTLPTICSV